MAAALFMFIEGSITNQQKNGIQRSTDLRMPLDYLLNLGLAVGIAHQLNHFIDQIVLLSLLCCHEIVSVGIRFDFLE